MNFEQLLYAEVLAQHHSLQKAADILHISKSGLSLAISQLEEELQVKLFERTARGTNLTDQGRQLLHSVSEILRQKNKLEKSALTLSNPSKHEKISIQYMNTMLTPFLSNFIRDYDKEYENTTLDINCHSFTTIVKNVRTQEIDAGFVAINNPNNDLLRGLEFVPVFSSKLALLCSPENPLSSLTRVLTLEDLRKQRFCLFDDYFHDKLFETLQFLCGPLHIVMRVDDARAMTETIQKLNTVSFARIEQSRLSDFGLDSQLKTIDISHLIDDHFTLGWLFNPQHVLSQKTELLIHSITEDIKRDAG